MTKKILIVDDEPTLVKLIRFELRPHGYELVTAGDGEEALVKVKAEKPDLIICDLMMPKKNGYEVCRELKGDPEYKHIPIILLSAKAMDEDKRLGRDAGADCYMTKPYESESFLSTVSEMLSTNGEDV